MKRTAWPKPSSVSSCKPNENRKNPEEKFMADRTAIIETNKGTIKFTLYEADAPITTANFIGLAERGFVIQGGCPQGTGTGGSDKRIKLEVSPKLKHGEAGAVAMARSSDPNSASSQFYITLGPASFLD